MNDNTKHVIVTVISPADSACRADHRVVITEPTGYIANAVTEETNCGGIDSPWLLRVSPGQRLNLTLLDYGALMSREQHTGIHVCQVLAVVKEKARGGSSETICTGSRREETIYMSTSNEVEIRIVFKAKRGDKERYFLIHYNGRTEFYIYY